MAMLGNGCVGTVAISSVATPKPRKRNRENPRTHHTKVGNAFETWVRQRTNLTDNDTTYTAATCIAIRASTGLDGQDAARPQQPAFCTEAPHCAPRFWVASPETHVDGRRWGP
eukprot:5112219-Pyramimonas_sp.AAC.4